MPRFCLESFDPYSKSQLIDGFDSLRLVMDWDDIDDIGSACELQKMLKILNDHWDDGKYKPLMELAERRYDAYYDDADEKEWDKLRDEANEIMRSLL